MMEEKKNEWAIKKVITNQKTWTFVGIVVIVVTAIIIVLIGGKGKADDSHIKINTPYVDLLLPLELKGIVTNEESTYGTTYTQAFYMNYGGKELPLWRIDFGAPNAGDWVGVLKTKDGDISVVTTGFVVNDEDLSALGEEGYQLYSECMQGYSVMLEGIMSDPRFTEEKPLNIGEDTDVKLAYWNVTLPDNMQATESIKEGNYEAVFSGEIDGEKVQLYRVCINEEQANSFLGYYEIDGVKKPVSVESFELDGWDSWSEDDYATAYRMMDTINDVIEAIMQSKQFSMEE